MPTLKVLPKVVPIRNKELTKERLVKAVGKVLADVGFKRLGVNLVAREADVDKKLIYRYFGGLEGLVAAYGRTVEFWPSAEELLGEDRERIRKMAPHALMSLFFKRHFKAILARPNTLEILAWEAMEKNHLTQALEQVRVKSALEFFELMEQDPPEEVDLTALVLLMHGAMTFLAVRSRIHRSLGGVDLQSESGWQRIERTLDQIMLGVLG
ncbi:TetR/AcrR family transcriptional regulator [Pseudodesulfovibrio sp.]|uniref:TetR/AcrR family transcriptional regulator n=1 Tax=Pseudodesulfovibrio sp. TaxID=2035812 RepID=UPI00261EF7CD|nr:TetR/AcrR family transcriptional regulator [Pseudodesulfovibrio sp.]MDD3312738.1 TetR/AcrR family transcriptional regulator [Pseudodesulfovibrio sp.]